MAQSHSAAFVNGFEHPVAYAEVVATPECLIELAKNVLSPVRCEWEAGTKDECGIILGSWMLLRKHLHIVHHRNTKREGFYCALPKCNQQFHPSYSTFVEHLDSAHLLRLMFCCPLPECQSNSLRGIESLQKHFETQHGHKKNKNPPQSVDPGMTWMPVTWHSHQLLENGSPTVSLKSDCSIASLKAKSRLGTALGTALASSIRMKKSQKLAGWIQEDVEENQEWLPSQPTMSQPRGLMGSQVGPHLMTRRKKRAKQLEKVKEIKRELDDEDEETIKVTLDDLARFDAERNLMGIVEGDIDGQGTSVMGRRWTVLIEGSRQQRGSRDIKLIQKAHEKMIVGRAMKQFMADLSRPQPMLTLQELTQGGGQYPELTKASKSITFGVMQKKIDQLEALGVEIDLDRLLHDPTL